MKRLVLPLVVLAVAAAPLAAQPPAVPFDPYRATIDTNLRLYADPVIQAELKLTDEQKAKLAKIPDDLLAKHKDAIAKETAANKDAAEKRAALQAEVDKKLDALIAKNLTAEQRKRLEQMVVQAMGVTAFRDAEIAKALALPEGYQAKLTEIQRAGREKLMKEFPRYVGGPGTPVEERRIYTEAQRTTAKETIDKFIETLTAEQKMKWKEMVGEPSEAASPGRAGTFGGPGGGSFLLGSRGLLIANEKALDELKVEKPARAALAEGSSAIRAAAQAENVATGGRGFREGIQPALGSEAATLAAGLLTAPQAARLEQIQFQMSGPGVFSSFSRATTVFTPTGGTSTRFVAAPTSALTKLTLTPAQVVKIDAVLADASKKQQELGRRPFPVVGFGGTETEEQKKVRLDYEQKSTGIESKALADIVATFDAGQKRAWYELTGEAMDLSKVTSSTPSRLGGFAGPPGARPLSIVRLWTLEAASRMSRGEYAAALATYDEAIRLAPTNTAFLQQKASLLASCPSEWVRDGKQAVEIMKKVMAETKEPGFTQYDALAMAHAEAGQFDEAVKVQEKAIAALPPDDGTNPFTQAGQRKAQYDARLKLYQDKKPYRMTEPKARPPVDR